MTSTPAQSAGAPDVGAPDVGAPDVGAPDVGAPDVDDGAGVRTASFDGAAGGGAAAVRTIRIASFDIGKKNFAYSVESYDLDEIDRLFAADLAPGTPGAGKARKRRPVSAPSDDFAREMVPAFARAGRTLRIAVKDLRTHAASTNLDIQTRRNIIAELEANVDLFAQCDYAIIEQQFFRKFVAKGRKGGVQTQANMDAIKIAELVIDWFLTRCPDTQTDFIPSEGKTHALGAPHNLDKVERKTWSIAFARKVCDLRADGDMLRVWDADRGVFRKRLNGNIARQDALVDEYRPSESRPDVLALVERVVRERQKLDDISDVILQCLYFVIRHGGKLRKIIGDSLQKGRSRPEPVADAVSTDSENEIAPTKQRGKDEML
jgi:hypothetical protein